jgi:bacillithiol system protein YtxJ
MNTIREIITIEDFNELWQDSSKQPVLLLKHSTTCPISANAYKEFNSFINQNNLESDETRLPVITALIKVIESRPTSLHIADFTKVAHQSPQILLIKDQQVIWKESHMKITKKAILEALQNETI